MSFQHRHHQHEGQYYGEAPPPSSYNEGREGYGYNHGSYTGYNSDGRVDYNYERVREEKKYQQKESERLGELGAVAAGAFALYEANKARNQHASKDKSEAELAGVASLGSAGYATYEHREKEKYNEGW